MAGSIVKHGTRCAQKIGGIVKGFCLGKQGFGQSVRLVRDSISDSWHDYKAPPMSNQRRDAMRLVNDGVRQYNSKNFEDALDTFRLATDYDPAYARAYVYLGNTLYKLSKHGEALRAWEQAISADPTSSAASKARAKVDKVQMQNQVAIRDLHEGLKK